MGAAMRRYLYTFPTLAVIAAAVPAPVFAAPPVNAPASAAEGGAANEASVKTDEVAKTITFYVGGKERVYRTQQSLPEVAESAPPVLWLTHSGLDGSKQIPVRRTNHLRDDAVGHTPARQWRPFDFGHEP
jgi:hypothetical protein